MMALSMSISRATTLFSLLVFLLALAISSNAQGLKLKKTEMSFYMHDWETATKDSTFVTNIPIAGNPQIKFTVLQFGTLSAIDDALTVAADRKSVQIGRARGLYVNSGIDGSELHMMMSIVFTNKAYNGSTLEIQGSNRFMLSSREVSIVSGTGKFRMARGYASIETTFLDSLNLNAILGWNLTIFHY